ncbi:MAG: MetQ/NlpA family lipoprotein [Legionellales bacterium]|nr:MetQ/NlpA family lipoprotein [Legionellales bacterium]
MRIIQWLTGSFILLLTLIGCGNQERPLRVGVISGPEATLMTVAQQVAKQHGVDFEIVEFTDYAIPNIALHDGSIDANVYQHLPYLQAAQANQGYNFTVIGKTFIYPMGGYSSKHQQLSDLPQRAVVAIPNDPSNEGRALILLQQAGLITLNKTAGFNATPSDIVDNPKQLRFRTLDAAQLPRVLADVDLALINSNFAVAGDLSPERDAVLLEDENSPYANLIVVRTSDQTNPELLAIVEAYQSTEVITAAKQLFGNQALPAWQEQP